MATYLVQQTDDATRVVEGVDAYAPEGALTTFFATRDGRGVIDSWAARVASFRTAGIVSIERIGADFTGDSTPGFDQGTNAPVNASVVNVIDNPPPTAYSAGSNRSYRSSTSAPAIANGNALVA